MSGFLTRAALALEPFGTSPVWPAAAAEEVTVLLPLLSENVRDVPVTQEINRVRPRSGTSASALRAVRVDGPVSLLAVYDGLEAVWAWALGLQHSGRPTELASGAYQHLYELDSVAHSHPWPFGAFNAGDVSVNQQLVRRATLAIERTVSVWEHRSTMVRSLTVYASPNRVSLALNLVGHSTDRASATNTPAVLAALSEPEWQVVEFHQLEARLAPFSAETALDGDDAISLTSLRLDVSHHLKTRPRRDTGLFIGEPRRDQLPEVTGSFTLPYYDSDTLVGWARAQTVLMAELRFTGAAIAATGYDYQLCFWLPALQLDAIDAGTQGAADREQRLNFRATVSDTAPAGFPSVGVPGPLYVEVVSADAINPLTGVEGGAGGEGGGGEDPPEEEELGGVTDGLRIWFKADDLAASLVDDDPVTSWTDASGNDITVTQGTGSAQPTYKAAVLNGHDVVRFGGNDVLSGSNPISDLTSAFTVFVVSTNLTSVTLGPFIATVAGTWGGMMFFYWASSGGAAYIHTEDNNNYRRGVTTLVPGPSLATARYEGGVATNVYYNGTLDNGLGGTNPASITNTASTLELGAHGSNFMNGDIAEIAFYDVALSTEEREAVEAALMTKYGLS